jgi:hypothetical protein
MHFADALKQLKDVLKLFSGAGARDASVVPKLLEATKVAATVDETISDEVLLEWARAVHATFGIEVGSKLDQVCSICKPFHFSTLFDGELVCAGPGG